ncbi:MBL fold metallo-hydrolase [Ferrimonas balearica]|uniref:MBL fold metallo-hydrolase n=1 Tax=Ferrimonas balearica TaxID=44012 RepID=UPI001C9A0CA1|nr:MBL fold metallo-hydrolase [Ferrimonas balearica]MBY5990612.1 MBL fold metallo-hydrolase [Ferrimonas balearica]
MSLSVFSCAQTPKRDWGSDQFREGRFHNADATATAGGNMGRVLYRFLFEKRVDPVPQAPIPVQPLDRTKLDEQSGDLAVRLGHSTVLLRLSGQYFLTDPVFGERASPVQWAGPKRFHDSPIPLEGLPTLAGVILSHDHYDHLDKATALALAERGTPFYAPLGVGQRLVRWGVDPAQVTELDWWQSVQVGSVKLVATPAQHFSGRSLSDSNRTLWASWALLGEESRVFFSGDSGYFDGFAEIGRRFGPFDLTLVETGAYDEDWPDIHMSPEQSVQAHRDLNGRVMIPIHNSTFDLALHAWYEPMERALAEAARDQQVLSLPMIGEPLTLGSAPQISHWWRAPEGEWALSQP